MSRIAAIGLFLTLSVLVLPVYAQQQNEAGSLSLSAESLDSLKESRLNAGIQSLSSYAHAYYRLGVEARKAGDSESAIKAFAAASELDPYFMDPHFSLFRAYIFRDPGRAFTELSRVVRLVRADFLAQHFVLKNLTLMAYIVLLIALTVFVAFVVARHLGALQHAAAERLSSKMPPKAAEWLALVAILQPIIWGLGAIGTILACGGTVWKCMNKRERFLTAVFVTIVIATPFLSGEIEGRFPPVGSSSPTYMSYVAVRGGWNDEVESALLKFIQANPKEAFYRFAYGTMARRAGRLGIAREELESAVALSPEEADYLVNLGNLYFNLGDFERAQTCYTKALSVAWSRAEAHYNLGQIYTKRLSFAEANEEFKEAKQINSELIDEFSLNSREQLNRSVIDARTPPSAFWASLLNEESKVGSQSTLQSAFRRLGLGNQKRSVMVTVFFALGLLAGSLIFRNLTTHRCSNCGKAICRKCLSRVQRQTYCLKCAVAASSVKSPEFTNLLLTNQRQVEVKRSKPVLTFTGIVLPGFTLVRTGRSFSGMLLLLLTATVVLCVAGKGSLIDYVPSLPYEHQDLLTFVLLVAPLVLIHGLVTVRLYRKASTRVPPLKLVRTDAAEKTLKNGAARKPGRLQSG